MGGKGDYWNTRWWVRTTYQEKVTLLKKEGSRQGHYITRFNSLNKRAPFFTLSLCQKQFLFKTILTILDLYPKSFIIEKPGAKREYSFVNVLSEGKTCI